MRHFLSLPLPLSNKSISSPTSTTPGKKTSPTSPTPGKTLLLLLLLSSLSLTAQEKPSPIHPGADAPAWMQLLQDETPNVPAIQQAYDAWYDTHPFEKNSYTQYFKRWMHWARAYTGPDGALQLPSPREQALMEERLLQLREEESTNAKTIKSFWQFVGPTTTFHTGDKTKVTWQTNIYSLDIFAGDANILYAGGETGGVWRTDDKGLSWRMLTTHILTGSVGAVKCHPTNPDIVYFGTNGKIMKSSNGGKNWTAVYTENNIYATDLAINPANPDIVLAATDKGLLLSTNAGGSWTKLHSQQTWTVKYKPQDPNTVFAIRKNGSGSQFLRSVDGGLTFSGAGAGWWTPGQGESVTGALLAVCPSNPDKIYAYECGSGTNLKGYIGVFVSADNGDNWANTHPQNAVGNSPTPYSIPAHTNLMTHNGVFSGFDQGFYDMAIVVNPSNDNELIAGGTSWFKSVDGGATWSALGSYVGGLSWSHPDIQWLAAQDGDLWIASDGGLNYSNNFAQSIEARMDGISGADLWGFDSGWNEDVLVGGRYHNGNMARHEVMPEGMFFRMGGAESPTGYVNPGDNRKLYFSDIGGYRLGGGVARTISSFPVGLFPNESYAYYANSEMAWDPRCWNIVYLGKDNAIWKSTDGGSSFHLLYTFPGNTDNRVFDIEVARSNPDVLYCSQWDGVDDAIWRSADGGQSWSKCAGLPLPNNNDRVKMAVSAENADVLWVLVTYGSNGKKVYKTTDGGQSWINLTTPLLDGIRLTNIMAQYGTDGGVYIGGKGGVFYRNNSHDDWKPFSLALPLSAETNRLKPFYRDGKIRNGCWGYGVWESPLYEPSSVLPQAMASALEVDCVRDTVYFNDYSVTRHEGVSWQWTLPGATYTAGTDARTPKCVYGTSGAYAAVMTLQTPEGVFRDTLHITVRNECEADPQPGQAATLGGNSSEGYVALPPLNIETNSMTVSAWIRPDGIQPDYSAIFMLDGPVAAGFNFLPGSNNIGYHWPNGAWWWNSGLSAPDGKWSHVAMVVTPDSVSIYLNGVRATHKFATGIVNFNQAARLGNYKGWGGRYVKGAIDEVCIYDRPLSQAEIREKMHLCRVPVNETGLLAYYQFNEDGGPALDRVGVLHGALSGSAVRIPSSAPVGPGTSARKTVSGAGMVNFPGVGLELDFSAGAYPAGELCATRIELDPDLTPGDENAGGVYWAVHNYSPQSSFATLQSLRFEHPDAGSFPAGDFRLQRRAAIGHGDTWELLDTADGTGAGSIVFSQGNGVNSLGQFVVTRLPGAHQPAADRQGPAAPQVTVFPNPATGGSFTVRTTLPETVRFRLFNSEGRIQRSVQFTGETRVSTEGLPAGIYYFRLEGATYMQFGAVVVE